MSRHSASLLPAATLRIYNSPSNMHDLGKHLACSLATQSHCYFNDDDWLNIYLDSLYTKYLECCDGRSADGESAGGRIASNTMPIIHLEHRRWRFENQGGVRELSRVALLLIAPCRSRPSRVLYVARHRRILPAPTLVTILATTKQRS